MKINVSVLFLLQRYQACTEKPCRMCSLLQSNQVQTTLRTPTTTSTRHNIYLLLSEKHEVLCPPSYLKNLPCCLLFAARVPRFSFFACLIVADNTKRTYPHKTKTHKSRVIKIRNTSRPFSAIKYSPNP